MNWKTTLAILVALLIFLVVAFSDQISKGVHRVEAFYSNKFHQSLAKGMYESFKKTADRMNKRGPQMKNKYVRFDKAEAGPGARITNFYTLVDHPANYYDHARLSALLKTKLAVALCKNAKVEPSLILGATYVFEYRGNDGIEVSHIEVNQQTCNTQSTQTAKP